MPGFNKAMSTLRDLIGFELMWEVAKTEEAETPKVIIN